MFVRCPEPSTKLSPSRRLLESSFRTNQEALARMGTAASLDIAANVNEAALSAAKRASVVRGPTEMPAAAQPKAGGAGGGSAGGSGGSGSGGGAGGGNKGGGGEGKGGADANSGGGGTASAGAGANDAGGEGRGGGDGDAGGGDENARNSGMRLSRTRRVSSTISKATAAAVSSMANALASTGPVGLHASQMGPSPRNSGMPAGAGGSRADSRRASNASVGQAEAPGIKFSRL